MDVNKYTIAKTKTIRDDSTIQIFNDLIFTRGSFTIGERLNLNDW